jgi:hypothetical protein
MPLSGVVPVAQHGHGINFFLYSDNGVGKTPLIGTGERTLILDADQGAVSAASFGSKARKKSIDSWDDLEEVYEYLRHEKHPYNWVWLDSVSTAQAIGLEDIMTDVVAARPHRKVYHPDKGEYGENMNRLLLWTRHMSRLPVNFGMTGHPFLVEDTEGNEQWMPFVQGKNMIHLVCSYMNVIGYLTIEERGDQQRRVLYTQKHSTFYGRDHFHALGGRMYNPTIPKIQAAIEAKIGATTTKKAAPPVKKAATKPTIRRNK